MQLGIRPTVDFAFKKTFGDPKNRLALISLLNAILDLPVPIADVTIENPFNYQDFADDKLSILDIKATDQRGSTYNIEMQVSIEGELVQRLVFYGCELYSNQLGNGQDYSALLGVFSICILDGVFWRDELVGHHRFRMVDTETKRVLRDTLEIHMLELPKYNIGVEDLGTASAVDRWAFWFNRAHEYDADELRKMFPEEAFQEAIASIETIAMKTEDKQMYDTREKLARDYQWLMSAGLKRAHNEGLAEGIEKGIEKGREKGREEGLEIGREVGEWIGTIRTCQAILELPVSTDDDLKGMTPDQLKSLATELQTKIRTRMGKS